MSTFNDFPYDFLTTFAIGGFVSVIMWLLARRLIRQSRLWRAVFCILVAATITPTCFPFIFGDWIIAPATLIALFVFGHSNVLFGFLFGVLPIVAIAGLIFILWSVTTSRRHRHEAVA